MCETESAARRAVPTGVALPFAPAAYLKDAEHRAGANHVITAVSIGFSQNQPWIFCCFSWIAFLPAPCHCVCTGIARIKNQEETNMTIDTAKELQMNIAKEGLALLVLHPTADVQLHRECISHIGTTSPLVTHRRSSHSPGPRAGCHPRRRKKWHGDSCAAGGRTAHECQRT